MTTIPNFQTGFRLIDGGALNKLVAQLNGLSFSAPYTNTAITTVGAGSLTVAALTGGLITRTGPTAVFTDTTVTAAALDAAMGASAPVGFNRLIEYKNSTAFAATIAGGTGVTVSGRTVVNGNSVGLFLLTKTAAATYTLVGISVTAQAVFGATAVVATADDGTTQTLTAAMVVGGNLTYHVTTGGTTPSLTLPLGTAIDTALPDMRVGQSYVLRIINSNSGTATVVTNTGWTTTGTLTLATNTWRDFVVTKTGTGTYTLVSVGTGTNS